jgi:hypothetical protein
MLVNAHLHYPIIEYGEYAMSKKTRKKIVRKNMTGTAGSSDKLTDNKSVLKSTVKVPPAVGKAYMSSEDLEKRYQYVKDDLKRVAIIAIPMILALIIASIFAKI